MCVHEEFFRDETNVFSTRLRGTDCIHRVGCTHVLEIVYKSARQPRACSQLPIKLEPSLYEQRKNIGKKRKDIIQTINLQGKRQNPREKTPVD